MYPTSSMNIACEQCGQSNPPSFTGCNKCGTSFVFLSQPVDSWKPWDFSQWLFSYHWGIVKLADASGFESLPRSRQLNYLVGYFYHQLMNGGLWQYLGNPCGPEAPYLVAALREIGAERTAAVVQEAISFFPNAQPPLDEDQRNAIIDKVPEEIASKLEDEATGLVNGEETPEDFLRLLHARCGWLEAAGA